jgi:hypothetical protein
MERESILPAMSIENLFLFFLACGALTFPLTLSALYFAASLSPARRRSPRLAASLETAISLSLVVWIVGTLLFYAVALHIERRKPCAAQHTNQLTAYCKKVLGAADQ